MWPYHPDLLATPVPRYTSYPTATEFDDTVGPAHLSAALTGLRGSASLYVHIPFCEQICWYCGCNTSVAQAGRMATYLDALHREIELVASRIPAGTPIPRIAFGGGSPNAITPVDLVRLVQAITIAFAAIDAQWSIELDPHRLDPRWTDALGAMGFARASLGVQTFAPRLQAAIGRVQPSATIENATARLRAAGVTSLGFDLMYGLPGQMIADLEDGLARTVALGADRIALFGYAHVPHLIARQRRIDAGALPGAAARFAMAVFGHRYLTDAGYVAVGFDHFALPGDPLAQAACAGRLHRNFQGFTDDDADAVIGLGASAITTTPDLIAQNQKNTGRYRMHISGGTLATTSGVRRSTRDRAVGAVIEALLCDGVAEVDAAVLAPALVRLRPFVDRGLVTIEGGRVRLSPGALPYARGIAAAFDRYRDASARVFSSAI